MAAPSPIERFPEVAVDAIGWLTEDQMVEVDRIMIEDLRIELIQMMENAGRHLASVIIGRYRPSTVTVLAGSGGNGGGGLVAARHLANRGVDTSVTLAKPAAAMTGVPAHQLDVLERMGVAVTEEPRPSEVTVDALIGYSLRGGPRGRIAELIGWIDDFTTVVALDTPSGLNVTDGSVPGISVLADVTVTLALPKIGLQSSPAVGELYLADISVPPSVYDRIGAGPAPPFAVGPILRCVGVGPGE